MNQPHYALLSICATCALSVPQRAIAQTAAGDPSPVAAATATAPPPTSAQKDAKVAGADADGDYVVDASVTAPTAASAASSTPPAAETAATKPAPEAATTSNGPKTSEAIAVPHAETAPKEPLVEISGYTQIQYESHQDSEDQLRQGGSLLNQNRFSARRVRLTFSRRYAFTGYLVELDGNTTNGPTIGLHRAEGSIFYQGKSTGQPALLELTAGMFLLPFGNEVTESSKARWFTERTTASRAFFPTEVDLGARLHGAWRFLRYGVALTNGEPKGTKATSFQLQDPNKSKDVTLRVGADVPASDAFRMSGGVSYLVGRGFSAGQDATKSRINWKDSDQNGAVSNQNELQGVPGTAALPSQNFRRWAVGADLQVRLRSRLGWTTVFGEAVAAVNLDRGLYIADPVATSRDVREFGWHVGITQQLSPYACVGFRYDMYDPDSDLTDSRGGQFLPTNQVISTYSPLVGLELPDRARLVFQYDFIKDQLARDITGVPKDLANNQWTLRLQVKL